jgi:predicted hydrocarbon binding protein
MKGIVFNLFEEVVTRERGPSLWDALLSDAALDGAYTSLGTYPDAHMQRLVGVAADRLGMTDAEVLRWFGRRAIRCLAERYPMFFHDVPNTRAFLLSLNHIIHPEVRKLHPGAEVPVFEFELEPPEALRMSYISTRRLCHLAEGFIEGTADWFGERVAVRQAECMSRGDARCVFDVRFLPGGVPS